MKMQSCAGFVCLFSVAVATAQVGRFKEKLMADDGAENDLFGSGVGVSGDWAVMGAPKQGAAAGAAYFFQWDGTAWQQQSRVTPSDGASTDRFGESAAIDGDTAIVGATRPLALYGKAYVFTESGGVWTEQASFVDTESFTLFGERVDIHGDTAIVGARLGTNSVGVATGVAHVFKRTGASWAHQAMLQAADGADGDWFGGAVAIDGDTAIVGANGRSNFTGGAYIFKRTGDAWSEAAVLNSPDGAENDLFGGAVDISGGWALVGTRNDANQGAYMYRLDGDTWELHAGLMDIYGRADFFGQSVALFDPYALVGGGEHAILWKRNETNWIKQVYMGSRGDDWDLSGTRMAVHLRNALTGHRGDDEQGTDAGAAWMLPIQDRNRQSEMIPTNMGLKYIGSGVAVDGERALVGASHGNVAQDFGYCGVFAKSGQYWLERTQLVPGDAADNMYFGCSASLAGDVALVGARRATNAAGNAEGVAYLFRYDGTNWQQEAKLTAPVSEADQEFGYAVKTDGDHALVGAPFFDSGGGKAVAYRRDGTNWLYNGSMGDSFPNVSVFGCDIGFDGARAIFGSPDEYEGGEWGAGAAYVYRLDGTDWNFEARVAAAVPSFSMQLGNAVDIDDDWAVCGAPREHAPINQSGAIYLYRRADTNWTQHARVPAPEAFTNGYFGWAVAMKKPYLLACANGTPARRAYLYKFDGTNWNLLTRFYPADGEPHEAFGSACDLSEDYALVGTDVQEGRKAYLFWRESWDPSPRIRNIYLKDGSVRIDLADLPIMVTCTVQRVSGAIPDDPGNWDDLVEIGPITQPETNNINPHLTNIVEFLRLQCGVEAPADQ